MTSMSQATTEAEVNSILSLFLRKLRSTFHAVSSELKQPSDRPLPPSSTAEGTYTRWICSAMVAAEWEGA
jgi:hypothetical protein